jgi:RHS repeat-associated protein
MQDAGGIGGLLARTDVNGSAFYHADGNGNITMMIDSSGNQLAKYLYDSFGNTIGMWGTLASVNTYRFSSKEIDARSGLYYYGYRYFEPNYQRFLNPDPIEEMGGINLYQFNLNSPENYLDPNGKTPALFYIGLVALDIGLVSQVTVNYQKYFGYSDQDRAAEVARTRETINRLQDIVNNGGEKTFQDEGLDVGGTMGATLPCNRAGQGLRNLFESMRNVEGWPSGANELANRIANNGTSGGIPSANSTQTPDQRAALAEAFIQRDQAYLNWLQRNY